MSIYVDTFGKVAQEIGSDRTFDPALLKTAIGFSAITFINGKKGILRHSG
jgi:hypothetical protein